MKKVYLLMAALLAMAGVQRVQAQDTEFTPVEGEFYVIYSTAKGTEFAVGGCYHTCAHDQRTDRVIVTTDDGDYRGLFLIGGSKSKGYYIRTAYDGETCLRYEPNVADYGRYSGRILLSKNSAAEPPSNYRWKFSKAGKDSEDWKICSKIDPEGYWSVTYPCNAGRHISTGTNYTGWYIVPLAEYKKSMLPGHKAYADIVDAEVQKLKQQGINTTTWAAFNQALSDAKNDILPASGWYRLRNDKKLYPEQAKPSYVFDTNYGLQALDDFVLDDGSVWKIEMDGTEATIIGRTGQRLIKNYHNPLHLTPTENAMEFTIRTHATEGRYFGVRDSKNSSGWGYKCGYWSEEDGEEARRFTFEKVEDDDPVNPLYNVNVCAPGRMFQNSYSRSFSYVDSLLRLPVAYAYDNGEGNTGTYYAYDKGFFTAYRTPAPEDFSVTQRSGYESIISFRDRDLVVSYLPKEYKGKVYRVARRATELEAGKLYAIYNTAFNTDTYTSVYYNKYRMGYITAGKQSDGVDLVPQVLCPGALVTADYAWTLDPDADGTSGRWAIRSTAKDQYLSWNGENIFFSSAKHASAILPWSAEVEEKVEKNVMAWVEGIRYTPNNRISADDHVWVIGNPTMSTFFNGNSSGFTTWEKAHPYAFYELEETDLGTGISDLEESGRPSATATSPIYDLQGRRVQRPARGIYIRGGKKYMFSHPM